MVWAEYSLLETLDPLGSLYYEQAFEWVLYEPELRGR